MKLPDFENFELFNILRQLMGNAPMASFSLNHKGQNLTKAELDILVGKGIDVDFEDIKTLADGTLGYKDSRVLVYIRDVPDYIPNYGAERLPKFHVSWCRTLDDMHQKNKFEKYVVSVKTDGKFEICRIGNQGKRLSIEELAVCRNCLGNLSFENYRKVSKQARDIIVEEFSIGTFFEKYPRELFFHKPMHSNFTAPSNEYSGDFNRISKKLKEKLNWMCQECSIYLEKPDLRKYLHVHHLNGRKNDNSFANLKVLCLKCHAEEEGHGHMKNDEYRTFLKIHSKHFAEILS